MSLNSNHTPVSQNTPLRIESELKPHTSFTHHTTKNHCELELKPHTSFTHHTTKNHCESELKPHTSFTHHATKNHCESELKPHTWQNRHHVTAITTDHDVLPLHDVQTFEQLRTILSHNLKYMFIN